MDLEKVQGKRCPGLDATRMKSIARKKRTATAKEVDVPDLLFGGAVFGELNLVELAGSLPWSRPRSHELSPADAGAARTCAGGGHTFSAAGRIVLASGACQLACIALIA